VGKAICDDVTEGDIVHEKGWMEWVGQKSNYGWLFLSAFLLFAL
jgi:hypothetical protein